MLDPTLVNFFDEDIVYWCEEDVDIFLQKYSSKDVIQCLFNRLKSISKTNYDWDWEWVWKLGHMFGDISQRYNAQILVYSWSEDKDIDRGLIFIFLEGY